MLKNLFVSFSAFFLLIGSVRAQVVAVDEYFNHETRKAKDGSAQRFHYTWEDQANTGFSLWGQQFVKAGAKLTAISEAPSASDLKGKDVYIIVDPDTKKENPSPNYISVADANVIAKWVKEGGVLVMLANDSANVELEHFNILAAKFGMHFNNDMQNHVVDDAHFDDGAIAPPDTSIFKTAKKLFLKDVCSISIRTDARPILKASNGAIIGAMTKYGKGTVIAVGDPWLYNEYVNGRLPAGFDNDKAMADLAIYLVRLAKNKGL